jgi:hypothetical protein
MENNTKEKVSYMGISTNGECPGKTEAGKNIAATTEKSLAREEAGFEGGEGSGGQDSATYELTGLSAEAHKFRACYSVNGGEATFFNRSIIVIPLP